jgi:hypothetical protein
VTKKVMANCSFEFCLERNAYVDENYSIVSASCANLRAEY